MTVELAPELYRNREMASPLRSKRGGAVFNNRMLLDLIKFCLGADVRFGSVRIEGPIVA